MTKHAPELTAAREYALGIIKLATGRPSPGALLLAFDYRAALRKLHADVLGTLSEDDARLTEVAVALIRAAYDAEKKGHLDPHLRNYAARLEDAARLSRWAIAHVARSNPGAMVRHAGSAHARTASSAIGERLTQSVIQDVFATPAARSFTLPARDPSAPHDRRKPTSIYARRGGETQPIATMVSVRI